MSDLDRDEFFKVAMHPDAMPDEMNFHLRAGETGRVGGDRSFSMEGFEAIGYQFHDWVMARTLAFANRHGRFPTGLRAEVKLVWDDDRGPNELNRDSDEPWFQLDDKGDHLIAVDGEHRMTTFLADRRSNAPDRE